MPTDFSFSRSMWATVDLPLPGSPVTQTHHPFFKVSYPPSSNSQIQNIVDLLISLRNRGYKQSTLKNIGYSLRGIAKHSDLDNPESVRAYISTKNGESYKKKLVDIYSLYAEEKNIHFDKPRYNRIHRLPYIPTNSDIDALIGGLTPKFATFSKVIMDTGARPIETWALKWIDVNAESNMITINNPARGSNSRAVKVTAQTIAMINQLPRRNQYIFRHYEDSNLEDFKDRLREKRNKIADKLQNPKIRAITPRSLRHFKATMTYHKTKDILYVKNILGHVSIQNTLIYTHLISFNEDEWTSAVAKNIEEARTLIENGFEYVTEIEGVKLLRKRK